MRYFHLKCDILLFYSELSLALHISTTLVLKVYQSIVFRNSCMLETLSFKAHLRNVTERSYTIIAYYLRYSVKIFSISRLSKEKPVAYLI